MHVYNSKNVKEAILAISETMAENAELLSGLDAAMGDGDLGIYMERGYKAAYNHIQVSDALPGKLLKDAGNCIMEEAPSTLGTLMGLFIRSMGRDLGDAPEFTFANFIRILKVGYAAITARGGAKPGEKTILDTLAPAITAIEDAHSGGLSPDQCIAMGYAAAQKGLEYSTGLRAVHGRPAYLGDKTIGMQDGGATVGMLLMKSLNSLAAPDKH